GRLGDNPWALPATRYYLPTTHSAPIVSCGFLDAQTRRPDTSASQANFGTRVSLLLSRVYGRAPARFSRQAACTFVVRVCDTERNRGCRHASQKPHQPSPPFLLGKTLFETPARRAPAFRAGARLLERRPALAAPDACHRSSSATCAEGPRPQRGDSHFERNCLRRNRFVRRPARSLPSLRISPRPRSRRCFENLPDRGPRRQARKLQNFPPRRKRPAHRRPAPQPDGIARPHRSLPARSLDATGSRRRPAAKPH